ncbi:MAG TPA: ABC transporter permease, partial [Gemmataceae bacterium]
VQAVQQGLDGLTRRQQGTLVVFQANKFCPATSHLPQDYERPIAEIPGVRDALPIQVYTNNCRASLDVVVFYGVPPGRLRDRRAFELLEGSWSEFDRHQDAALVGRAVAQRRGVRTGDKFSVGELTVTVAGVFASREDPAEESYVYTHLDFLQRRRGADLVGTVTQLEVRLEEGADPEAVCAAIDERFRGGPVQTDTRPKGVFQASSLADLFELVGLAHYLGFVCVGLMAVLVATTAFMAVQDRVREHAVLQTIGFSWRRVFGLVLGESALLSLAGGSLGVGLAMLALAYSGLSVGAEAVVVTFAPSAALALQGLALAALIGVLAGLAPAWQASRTEIVPALRQA